MRQKKTGEVYTPFETVENILNLSGYKGNKIIGKHIIDNSFGEGAFLIKIVERYIKESRFIGEKDQKIAKDLSKFIHGIEINEESYLKAIINLNELLKSMNFKYKVNWNLINENTLEVNKYNYKMDYVIGNPPYIRIHDLDFQYKEFEFAKKGMTDLYIIFFEVGIKMLNEKGILAYITPNSFLTSEAGLFLRKKIYNDNLLEKVLNLRHDNPFKGISTYPIITVLNKDKESKSIKVYKTSYDFDYSIKNGKYMIDNKFFFERENDLRFIKKVYESKSESNDFVVRNGLATNADSIFYNDNYIGEYVIDAVKASRNKRIKLFYPYDKNGNVINIENIKRKNKEMYNILISNKKMLQNRSLDDETNWHTFARRQGIKDVYKNKLHINTIIRDLDSLKIGVAESGTAVYSGLYIYSDSIDLNKIKQKIYSEDFIRFVKCLGKDKSGKYYFLSSNDMNIFLNYSFKKDNEKILGVIKNAKQRFVKRAEENNIWNKQTKSYK